MIWIFRLPILLLALALGFPAQSVIISEFMADNAAAHSDFEGKSSDWIELYNTGGTTIDLAFTSLTDDAGSPMKWIFPSPTILPPGAFLVVFASGLDRRTPGQELHTNFRLADGGEHLSLRASNGSVLSSFGTVYPKQYRDVSYGFPFLAGFPQGTAQFLATPTPGAPNGSAATVLADLNHSPSLPLDTDPIAVTVRPLLQLSAALTAIQLRYRVQYGPEVVLAMNDAGVMGDLVAADGIFTALIPASASAPGQMVRYRVSASDSLGAAVRAPVYRSPTNSPEYLGTMVQAPTVTSALRVFYWFVQSPVLAESASGTRASIFWDGTLYDNVYVRLRGQTSASYPKKSFKFDFNSGYHCAWSTAVPAAEEVNINTTWADKAYVRQELSYEVYDLMGAPGSVCETVRVQQNGSFYSVAAFVEQPDERMLLREGISERGALYKMYNTLDSSINGVEKKTRHYESNADLSQLVTALSSNGVTLENWLFDNINIPAVLNYLVATSLVLDNDHVHKNYYVYRDSEGSLEWLFLPWDKDLTLGRNFTLGGGVLNDTMYSNQDPESHPLFGDQQHPKVDGPWNRLIDAIYRTPRLRAMYLRRLRSGMDQILNAPGTPIANRHYESRIAAMQAQMGPDVLLDQAAWGIPSWGAPLNFSAAIGQLLTSHLAPRRIHLYTTHGGGAQPLIDPPQPTVPALLLGAVDAQPASGNQGEEFLQVINCASTAVDLSGFILSAGSVFAVLPDGVVVPANGSVYLSPNVRAFRTRVMAPTGGQGHFVVKAYTGDLQASVPIQLLTPAGALVIGGPAFTLATTGVQDVNLNVQFAAPFSELFIPISADLSAPFGCGPFAGMGADAVFTVVYPIGTQPFHVRADAQGQYSFSLPPSSLPAGVTIDARVIALSPQGTASLSRLIRVTF